MKKKRGMDPGIRLRIGGISVLRGTGTCAPQKSAFYTSETPKTLLTAADPQRRCENSLLTTLQRSSPGDQGRCRHACNTATAAAIECLRARYPGKIIIGMEPALKLAAERHPGGRILVMATHVTLRGAKILRSDGSVFPLPAGWFPCPARGWWNTLRQAVWTRRRSGTTCKISYPPPWQLAWTPLSWVVPISPS